MMCDSGAGVGWDGPDHCPACHAEADRLCAQFEADVASGQFDAEGFTPKERKAQRKRRQAEGRLF